MVVRSFWCIYTAMAVAHDDVHQLCTFCNQRSIHVDTLFIFLFSLLSSSREDIMQWVLSHFSYQLSLRRSDRHGRIHELITDWLTECLTDCLNEWMHSLVAKLQCQVGQTFVANLLRDDHYWPRGRTRCWLWTRTGLSQNSRAKFSSGRLTFLHTILKRIIKLS